MVHRIAFSLDAVKQTAAVTSLIIELRKHTALGLSIMQASDILGRHLHERRAPISHLRVYVRVCDCYLDPLPPSLPVRSRRAVSGVVRPVGTVDDFGHPRACWVLRLPDFIDGTVHENPELEFVLIESEACCRRGWERRGFLADERDGPPAQGWEAVDEGRAREVLVKEGLDRMD
ncbi:hypothetical protein BV20DRAFT_1054515 [Pilatotrama ljubarskyi]|nr:hypothetical protein BV20DRAFT_1054515 [Pilatotrama ljubarskyi]